MISTYKIESLGCKANQSDALSYAALLHAAGWKEAQRGESASLIVVQTCTVTLSADARGRQLIRKLKRENPDSQILMTGCYAQQLEGRPEPLLPEVDYVLGNLNPRKWEILSEITGSRMSANFKDFPMPAETARTRQYIKIQDGCDARCSYCIIPKVRGKSRSLPVEEVLRRVEHYRDHGYKEMILTGISMGAYGKDLSPKTSLGRLMKRIDALCGEFKIRLSSVEPEEIDDEFLDVFTSSFRFQPHLHLPLQSASNQVLKKMRRQYLFHHYDFIVSRLVAKIPDVNLGTDILVGFPEEDEGAFQETYRYVGAAPFAYCHVFPFSPRPDTPAAGYKQCATRRETTERASQLRTLAREKNMIYRKRFLGRSLRGLVLHGAQEALTDNYIRVHLSSPVPQRDVVSVVVDSVLPESTFGHLVGWDCVPTERCDDRWNVAGRDARPKESFGGF